MANSSLKQRRQLSTQKAGTSDTAATNESSKKGSEAKPTGNRRSLTFAIGGVLTLLGVASYTFSLRQQQQQQQQAPLSSTVAAGTSIVKPSVTQPQIQTTLQSVAEKRDEARKKLDGLSVKERREQARKLGLLTEEEVDAILHAKEKSWCLNSSKDTDTMKLRIDTNQVSSNDPIEDYLAWDILQPRDAKAADTESSSPSRFMFGVFDGHAGYMCAEQIASRIGPMMNQSLELTRLSTTPQGANDGTPLAGTVRQLAKEAGLNWDQTALALTATFINMDYELVHGALAEFRKSQDLLRMDQLLGPAVSGSCGLVAVVDTKAQEVVVGNTGDSRALLGVRLANGNWKAVRLSEDQNASNKYELARMHREHPGETDVIRKGRVLGGLMPTRAFGDSRYKWSLETQQDLFPVLYARGHRYATTPPGYLSPPYVTARPVI
ncbi:[Pyruvate dehydrogenase [acetyl-transferring]]-phosphatase 1, mitochondrial, partial [Dipsacomyces acuminosporus]